MAALYSIARHSIVVCSRTMTTAKIIKNITPPLRGGDFNAVKDGGACNFNPLVFRLPLPSGTPSCQSLSKRESPLHISI